MIGYELEAIWEMSVKFYLAFRLGAQMIYTLH
jgi:hypothetical protein